VARAGVAGSGLLSGVRRRIRAREERGAALVEFALILPVVVTLALGIISGGAAYQSKLSMSNGAREGARYGATLPIENFTSLNAWLDNVATVAVGAVDDGLPSTTPGRIVCVAYVYPVGTATNDRTTRRYETSGTPVYSNTPCFTDGRPTDERRVQVRVVREGELDAGFFTVDLELAGRGIARYEAIAG
jgi:hypothetical protein